jgi:hypothetical protein
MDSTYLLNKYAKIRIKDTAGLLNDYGKIIERKHLVYHMK